MAKLSKSEIIEFPSLTRKRNRIEICNGYRQQVQNEEKDLSRATMYKLMNHLTNNDEAILTAIDYITAILVNEPCEMLQDVIDRCVCTTKQTEMARLLSSAQYFLKHKYKTHVLKNDDVCYHGLNYYLGRNTW